MYNKKQRGNNDTHILFDDQYNQVFVNELKCGDQIITKYEHFPQKLKQMYFYSIILSCKIRFVSVYC